jgi:hypothetical protein
MFGIMLRKIHPSILLPGEEREFLRSLLNDAEQLQKENAGALTDHF